MDVDGLGFNPFKRHTKKLKRHTKKLKRLGGLFGKKKGRRGQAAPAVDPGLPILSVPAAIPGDPGYTTYAPPPYGMQPYQDPAPYPFPPPQAAPFNTGYAAPPMAPGYDDFGPMVDDGMDPFDAGGSPFDADGSSFDTPDPVPYGQEEEYGLEGLFDSDYWKQKWDEAVAWFQAKVAQFFAMKHELVKRDRLVNAAIAAAEANPQHATALRRLRSLKSDLSAAVAKQNTLEPKVTEQLKKINLVTEQKTTGLGVVFTIPLAIGAASVAAVVAVGGLVVLHMSSSKDLNRQIDLAAAGVLSPADLERIKNSGADPLGLGNLKTLGYIAGAGFALYLLSQYFGGRRAA